MKHLGKVLHLSNNKNFILRSKRKIKSHQTVFDNYSKPVGKVIDVFGPVKNPFVTIKPLIDNPKKIVGKVLYLRK